jgi:hypothetical protein
MLNDEIKGNLRSIRQIETRGRSCIPSRLGHNKLIHEFSLSIGPTLSINGTEPLPTAKGETVMIVSLKDDSAFLRWRRLVIVEDESRLIEPCAALDSAQIPHIVGLHYRYRTPTGKPHEAEPWIMVPFHNYSAARSLVVPLSKTQNITACADVPITGSSD